MTNLFSAVIYIWLFGVNIADAGYLHVEHKVRRQILWSQVIIYAISKDLIQLIKVNYQLKILLSFVQSTKIIRIYSNLYLQVWEKLFSVRMNELWINEWDYRTHHGYSVVICDLENIPCVYSWLSLGPFSHNLVVKEFLILLLTSGIFEIISLVVIIINCIDDVTLLFQVIEICSSSISSLISAHGSYNKILLVIEEAGNNCCRITWNFNAALILKSLLDELHPWLHHNTSVEFGLLLNFYEISERALI